MALISDKSQRNARQITRPSFLIKLYGVKKRHHPFEHSSAGLGHVRVLQLLVGFETVSLVQIRRKQDLFLINLFNTFLTLKLKI